MFKNFWRLLSILLAGEDPEEEKKPKSIEEQLEVQKVKLLDLQSKLYSAINASQQRIVQMEAKIEDEKISDNLKKQYEFEIEFCKSQLKRLEAKRELLQQDVLELERWRRQYEIGSIEQDIYDCQNDLLNLKMDFLH
ncbi:MAG: hypothetical protein JG764_1132 [Clostridiales bacterium]|nr:hypothetical protein [Clostridiales bacterium]